MQGPIWHVPMTFEKKTKKEYFLNLRKKIILNLKE